MLRDSGDGARHGAAKERLWAVQAEALVRIRRGEPGGRVSPLGETSVVGLMQGLTETPPQLEAHSTGPKCTPIDSHSFTPVRWRGEQK